MIGPTTGTMYVNHKHQRSKWEFLAETNVAGGQYHLPSIVDGDDDYKLPIETVQNETVHNESVHDDGNNDKDSNNDLSQNDGDNSDSSYEYDADTDTVAEEEDVSGLDSNKEEEHTGSRHGQHNRIELENITNKPNENKHYHVTYDDVNLSDDDDSSVAAATSLLAAKRENVWQGMMMMMMTMMFGH